MASSEYVKVLAGSKGQPAEAPPEGALQEEAAQGPRSHLWPKALRPQRHGLDPLRARAPRVEQLHPLALAREGHQRGRAAPPAHAPGAGQSPTSAEPLWQLLIKGPIQSARCFCKPHTSTRPALQGLKLM